MNWNSFQIEVPAKWVLAGEHAVLRGAGAVALPHPEFRLSFDFVPSSSKLEVIPEKAESVVKDLIEAVRDQRARDDLSFIEPRGRITLKSSIPIGAGLGSSAALCVAVARWLQQPLGMHKDDIFTFARELEHRFHGRSSGMDVAVTAAGEPITFTIAGGAKTLGVRKLPKFTFHDTGLRSRTSDCVHQVQSLREDRPHFAMKIDEQMSQASRLATEGLIRYQQDHQTALEILTQSMNLSRDAFQSWGLSRPEVESVEQDLLESGALAVKMTGSGAGGFVVALWS